MNNLKTESTRTRHCAVIARLFSSNGPENVAGIYEAQCEITTTGSEARHRRQPPMLGPGVLLGKRAGIRASLPYRGLGLSEHRWYGFDVLGCGTQTTDSMLQPRIPDRTFKKDEEKKTRNNYNVHSRAPTNHQTRAYHQSAHFIFMCKGALSRLGFLFDLPLSPDLRSAKGQAALELRAGQQMWPVELPTQLRHSSFAALWRNPP